MFQITLWLILWWKPISVLAILSKMFFAGFICLRLLFLLWGLTVRFYWSHDFNHVLLCIYVGVSLFAALGFLLYGGRWLSMSIFNCIRYFGLWKEIDASDFKSNTKFGILPCLNSREKIKFKHLLISRYSCQWSSSNSANIFCLVFVCIQTPFFYETCTVIILNSSENVTYKLLLGTRVNVEL